MPVGNGVAVGTCVAVGAVVPVATCVVVGVVVGVAVDVAVDVIGATVDEAVSTGVLVMSGIIAVANPSGGTIPPQK